MLIHFYKMLFLFFIFIYTAQGLNLTLEDLSINDADYIYSMNLSKIDISTQKDTFESIFLSNQDSRQNIDQTIGRISTQEVSRDDYFISNQDSEDRMDLSKSSITASKSAYQELFLSNPEIVITKDLILRQGLGLPVSESLASSTEQSSSEYIQGNIEDVSWPAKSTFGLNEIVPVDITFKNTGPQAYSFWLGYSVQDSSGKWWDAPPKITSSTKPDDTGSVQLQWQPPEAAPLGAYTATVALWKGYDDSTELMEGELDRKTKNNAFQLNSEVKIAIPDVVPEPEKPDKKITVEGRTTSTEAFKIEGHVWEANQDLIKPIENAKIKCFNDDGLLLETTSNSEGYYVLVSDPLNYINPKTEYHVVCSKDMYSNTHRKVETSAEGKAQLDISMYPLQQQLSKSEESLYEDVVYNLHIKIQGPENPAIGETCKYIIQLDPLDATGISQGLLYFAYEDDIIDLNQDDVELYFKGEKEGDYNRVDLTSDYNKLWEGILNIVAGKIADVDPKTAALKLACEFGALFLPELKTPLKDSAYYDINAYDILTVPYRDTTNPPDIKMPRNGVKIIIPVKILDDPKEGLHIYTSWEAIIPKSNVRSFEDAPDISIPLKSK